MALETGKSEVKVSIDSATDEGSLLRDGDFSLHHHMVEKANKLPWATYKGTTNPLHFKSFPKSIILNA
jgi:hypothetical protein